MSRRRHAQRSEWLGLSSTQWLIAAVMLVLLIVLVVRASSQASVSDLPSNVQQGIVSAGCGSGCTESNVTLKSVSHCSLSDADRAAGITKSFDVLRHSSVSNDGSGHPGAADVHFTAYQKADGTWEADAAPDNTPCRHL